MDIYWTLWTCPLCPIECPIESMPKFSQKRQFGNLGEDIAEVFLVKQGHKILERNYLKKWGEIDIVAIKDGLMRFIEVKSQSKNMPMEMDYVTREKPKMSLFSIFDVSRGVSRKRFTAKDFKIRVSRETDTVSDFDPMQNVHYWKQKRMMRAIQTYILERRVDEDQEWQIDIIAVSIDFLEKTATIRHIENVVFT